MKITFLGTSHGIAEKHQFLSSAVVTVGGKHYIIDAGAPLTSLLKNHDIDFKDINGIFITHPHFDHFIGLTELTFQINGFNQFDGVKIPTYVPDLLPFKRMMYYLTGTKDLNPYFGYDEKYNNGNYGATPYPTRITFNKYSEGVIFKDDLITITAVKNMHIEDSYSFLLETKDKAVVFSGDLKHGIPDYPKCIIDRATNLDAVILEGAHTKLCLPKVLEVLKKSKTNLMLINHYYAGVNNDDELLLTKNLLKAYFPLKVVKDNDVFEI